MKITYHKNPLCTTVELDDHEKEVFRLKIKAKELEDIAYSAYFTLTHHDWHNANISKSKPRTLEDTVNEAVKELEPEYWLEGDDGKKSKLDERVDALLQHYIEELQSSHVGDCTCVPMSCSKCHAESILGIDTVKGLRKHSAYKVDAAFGKDNEKTMEEALESLRNYDPTATWEGWEAHAPRWKKEAEAAYEWLLNYRNTHFKEQS